MKMTHLDLLGIDLKSDVLNDLFETYHADVVYRYDRTNENAPDEYMACVPELGLEFIFDSKRKLRTLFMTNVVSEGFNPFEQDAQRLPKFSSKAEAVRYASTNAIQISQGCTDFLGEQRDWIKLEYTSHSVHYEFVDAQLNMVTIQATNT